MIRVRFTIGDWISVFSRVTSPWIGRFTGAFYGFLINPIQGILWGWRFLRVHPMSLFFVEEEAVLDLRGVLYVGFFRKAAVPMPGKRRTGLTVKRGGVFRSGNKVHLTKGSSVHVSNNAVVEIGDNTFISYDSVIVARKKISIGSDCAIGWGVTILDSPLHKLGGSSESEPVRIGSKVWIGHNVSILQGVSVGEGAVIGSNSLVTRDIPPRTLAVGTPAKVIRENIVWEL